jgi:serralysin
MGNPASETGVFVNLLSGRGHFADAEHDVYSSIENVVGSEFDDIIQDSIEDNLLMGQGGDDVLIATEGNVKVI